MAGHSVLVVDDVRFTRVTLTRMLQKIGIERIADAEDGGAALRALEGADVDCVVSDLDMPNVNGLQLLKAIRSGTGSIRRDIPVVFLTGHSELEHLGPALLLDLDAFLAKPVSQEALQKCLNEIFDPARKRRPAAAAEEYAQVDLAPAAIGDAGGGDSSEATGRAVSLAEIPANAVLARDVLYSNGRLLLRAGSQLSQPIIDRVRDLATLVSLPDTVWIRE